MNISKDWNVVESLKALKKIYNNIIKPKEETVKKKKKEKKLRL